MNKILPTLILSFVASLLLAQQTPGGSTPIVQNNTKEITSPNLQKEVIVSGSIIEKDTGVPLEYATVAFFSQLENRIVTGGISDVDGNFRIPVPAGVYDISIEFISFKKVTISNKKLIQDENLGSFALEIDAESLDEVEIIAERTTVEFRLDKKIYNIGKDLTVRGGTVSDVLDNVPSVSVDVEGNVSLRGNDDVRILINGKPSGLVGLNSTDALRQLPAESIERVEVITSPSARYDAEGTAGILNIILRRSKLQGLNGAITVNGGYPTSAGISGNINYRTGDFNFFNTTGYNYREVPGNSFTETEFFNDDDPSTFLTEDREFDRIRKGINTNFGVEWYVNDTFSITNSIVYRNSDNESNTINLIDETDAFGTTTRTTRFDPELEDDKTIQYSLNLDKQWNGNSDHRLTFEFQYETSEEDERSFVNQDGTDVEDVSTVEAQDRVLIQTDFVQPLGENGQFELGYRGNFNKLDTDYNVAFSDDGINFEPSSALSNNLLYDENVNAFYSQFGNKLGEKFSYLLGLRMESTRITINQITSGNFEKKNYTQLFPTVNLAYEITEDESFTIGYSRRIRRPRSRFINPFPSRSSPTSLFQGDPDLDPSISDAFDIGYLNRLGKLTISGSVYFQHATDIFSFITRATDDFYSFETNETVNINDPDFDEINANYDLVPVVIRGPINLATNDRYGGEITFTYRPNRKFNVNANFNLFQSITKGDYQGQNFDAENLSWFARLNAKYTLPGAIDWQTRLFYRGPSETAQSKNKGIFSTDLAFSKDVFNENGSLAFRVSDLFNTRKRVGDSFTPTFNSTGTFQWRQRSYNVSFTYRFNQKKKRERSNGQGGDDDLEFEG
ncbi:MAG: TonB-dependent receptor [Flavobacteriaceae bacterium]|nr:TonB-dependent receptor [Flavobacteriaceae bacterium]NNK60166.1 TonB-dependent receptor [Flavobacteriaceae bacterium]